MKAISMSSIFPIRRGLHVLLLSLLLAACSSQAVAPAPTTAPLAPTPALAPTLADPTALAVVEQQPVAGGPTLLREGIVLRKVVAVEGGSIRLARNPLDGAIYVLNPVGGLARVQLAGGGALEPVAELSTMIEEGTPTGMAFGPDGSLYLVANRQANLRNEAIIRRGTFAADGSLSWVTVATSEPYPLSGTPFDHQFNGIVVSPDGAYLYVNSGSRTDHGEVETNNSAFPGVREVPLTSKIFRLPADATDLLLPNDEAALERAGLIYARGTRNAYDLAFAPNGQLFGVDNGPDADYADELNWLREGAHYGFPWRFGNQDNPQQFPDYDSSTDLLLHPDFTAVKNLTYRNDPTFPLAPTTTFANPVRNNGPAATQYRAADGAQRDAAAAGETFYGLTAHRSPLGLVFADDPAMPAAWRGEGDMLSAFVLSWGSAGGTLSDTGQDLLHMQLSPDEREPEQYQARTNQIAKGFKNPIDALLIENRLYVLEYGQGSTLWELTFR